MSANSNMSISSIRTATRRLTYFFRRGNKENRENQFRELFRRRANIIAHPKSGSNLTSSKLFQFFFLSATPFIGLKTRRRGKKSIVKLVPLERIRGERRSFIALSKLLRISGAVTKPFSGRLGRELEALSVKSAVPAKGNNTSIDSKNIAGSSAIRDKRNGVHKLAYASMPYR